MKNKRTITFLSILIAVFSCMATLTGTFYQDNGESYQYTSIRGKVVTIYGKGLYKHMSAEVAPQGIAQDYVTLFIGIPLLIISLWFARRGSTKGKYLLSGTLFYFMVTYLFYTVMSMYNQLFLVYVLLMGTSFYAFLLTLQSYNMGTLKEQFKSDTPYKTTGSFLIFSSVTIGLLWLSIVVPPIRKGNIPDQVELYTTLIVQGLDLGILLPAAFICGILWRKKAPIGYLLAPAYFVFLSILMTALTAKLLYMAQLGYNVMPAIILIPAFNIISIVCTIDILKNIVELNLISKFAPHKTETSS